MGSRFSCGGSKKKAKKGSIEPVNVQPPKPEVGEVKRRIQLKELSLKTDKNDDLSRLGGLVLFVENSKKLNENDYAVFEEIGAGTFASVRKVFYKPIKQVAARKAIYYDGKKESASNILKEVATLKSCNSQYITTYYEHAMKDNLIYICMEYMDFGSLFTLLTKVTRFPQGIISMVAESCLKGLIYLEDTHKMIHRDIKPHNVLVNSKNEIKLGDLGLCCIAQEPIVEYVGDPFYMSPERIMNDPYDVKGDVWSLGILVLELAFGMYPYPHPIVDFVDITHTDDPNGLLPRKQPMPKKNLELIELINSILNEPTPFLPKSCFHDDIINFSNSCLIKDTNIRSNLDDLIKHSFIIDCSDKIVDADWFRKASQFPSVI